MAERILGPVYPALLAPGLGVVLHDPGRNYDGLDAVVQAIADGPPGAIVSWVNPTDAGITIEWEGVAIDGLRIDYADPHTRDRVARALEVVLRGDVATTCPALDWLFSYPSRSTDRYRGAYDAWYAGSRPGAPARLSAAMRLRAVAAAVWGPR